VAINVRELTSPQMASGGFELYIDVSSSVRLVNQLYNLKKKIIF